MGILCHTVVSGLTCLQSTSFVSGSSWSFTCKIALTLYFAPIDTSILHDTCRL